MDTDTGLYACHDENMDWRKDLRALAMRVRVNLDKQNVVGYDRQSCLPL